MSEALAYRIPPQNLESEQCVLGSVLLENAAVFQVIDIIKEDDFYREAHKKIFRAINRLTEKSEPVDLITLKEELSKSDELESVGGVAYLAEIAGMVPTAANAVHYAKIVKGKSLERCLLNTCTGIINDIYNAGMETETLLSDAEAKVFQVTGSKMQSSFSEAKETVGMVIKNLEERYENPDAVRGVNTGYKDLDDLFGGFKPGQLIIIAARPSVGKTALALNIARNTSLRMGNSVAVFSLEMTKEEVMGRFICSEGRVDVSRFLSAKLKDDEMGRLMKAAGNLSDAKIYVDETSGITPSEIRAKCRRIHSLLAIEGKKLDLVIVGYIQLMRVGGSVSKSYNREQIVSEISRTLKEIAKELKVPIISLAQLNRDIEKRSDKKPLLSDLRESGSIEQDADAIIFIHRDETSEDNHGLTELIVAKHRNGRRDTVKLTWLPQYTAFENSTHGSAGSYNQFENNY